MKFYSWFVGVMAALLSVLVPSVAMAAVDVTATVGQISGNEEGMTSIGTAMMGLAVIVVLFTMARRVLK